MARCIKFKNFAESNMGTWFMSVYNCFSDPYKKMKGGLFLLSESEPKIKSTTDDRIRFRSLKNYVDANTFPLKGKTLEEIIDEKIELLSSSKDKYTLAANGKKYKLTGVDNGIEIDFTLKKTKENFVNGAYFYVATIDEMIKPTRNEREKFEGGGELIDDLDDSVDSDDEFLKITKKRFITNLITKFFSAKDKEDKTYKWYRIAVSLYNFIKCKSDTNINKLNYLVDQSPMATALNILCSDIINVDDLNLYNNLPSFIRNITDEYNEMIKCHNNLIDVKYNEYDNIKKVFRKLAETPDDWEIIIIAINHDNYEQYAKLPDINGKLDSIVDVIDNEYGKNLDIEKHIDLVKKYFKLTN